MSYEEMQRPGTKTHNITMTDRKRLTVTGVETVDSYDEKEIIMQTQLGSMTVKGQDLKLDGLSTQTGDVTILGLVSEISYGETAPSGSLWSRLFR